MNKKPQIDEHLQSGKQHLHQSQGGGVDDASKYNINASDYDERAYKATKLLMEVVKPVKNENYECLVCNKTFTRKYTLSRHLSTDSHKFKFDALELRMRFKKGMKSSFDLDDYDRSPKPKLKPVVQPEPKPIIKPKPVITEKHYKAEVKKINDKQQANAQFEEDLMHDFHMQQLEDELMPEVDQFQKQLEAIKKTYG